MPLASKSGASGATHAALQSPRQLVLISLVVIAIRHESKPTRALLQWFTALG